MKHTSHRVVNAAVAYTLGTYITVLAPTLYYRIVFTIIAVLASTLPDVLEFIGKHRTWTHSVSVTVASLATITYNLLYVVHTPESKVILYLLTYTLVGYALHILADALSVSGVPILFSGRPKIALHLYKTSHVSEFCTVLLILAGCFILLYVKA